MASSVQTSPRIGKGVPPLRAGQGNSFFWRRLHSLSGIIPVGVFLTEHMISNFEATNGPAAYNNTVKFLTSLPALIVLEWVGIFIPILFHAGYGIYIWWRGDNNVTDYPWQGNWMYTLQRYTGIIVFAYILFHTYTMRFTGVHLATHPDQSFAKVQAELMHPWAMAIYVIGVVTASWHFGYGIFLFCAKWGIATGERARKRVQAFGIAVAILFMVLGLSSAYAFVNPKNQVQDVNATSTNSSTQTGMTQAPATTDNQ